MLHELVIVAAVTGLPAESVTEPKRSQEIYFSIGLTKEYLDEPMFTTVGGSWIIPVTARLGLRQEVLLNGGDNFNSTAFGAHLAFDLSRGSRVTPYVMAGGGLLNQGNRWDDFRHMELYGEGGVGVRAALGDHWLLAPEVRFGWGSFPRVLVNIGYTLREQEKRPGHRPY